tara:strand:- start:139 stop:339 length:201 start_codon:yes stop_codon:yes gene_type:complete
MRTKNIPHTQRSFLDTQIRSFLVRIAKKVTKGTRMGSVRYAEKVDFIELKSERELPSELVYAVQEL